MNQIKKLLALLLALVMVLAMAACGSGGKSISGSVTANEEEDISGTVETAEEAAKEESVDETVEEAEEAEEAVEETAEETAEETVEAEEAGVEEAPALEIGSMVGGVYENSYIGIGCELDSNWVYATEEELAVQNQVSAEAFDDEALREQLANADIFYDMMAQSTDSSCILQVVFENLGVMYGTLLDEQGYIDLASGNLETSLVSAGFTNIQIEQTTVNFAGQERQAIYVVGDISGITAYQLMIPIKAGNHMAIVNVSSYIEDITGTLAELFYAVG